LTVTEKEWLTTDNPTNLLNHVGATAHARKFRCVAAEVARTVRSEVDMLGGLGGRVIRAVEAYADGKLDDATAEQLRLAVRTYLSNHFETLSADQRIGFAGVSHGLAEVPFVAAHNTVDATLRLRGIEYGAGLPHARYVVDVIRCIVGNPFRPVACDPSWRTTTVVGLTDAIYTERAFDRLPILADALEEAGCTHPDVLAHCRGDGPHARGCWVVDLILGKS
jgi:hypothetical protein